MAEIQPGDGYDFTWTGDGWFVNVDSVLDTDTLSVHYDDLAAGTAYQRAIIGGIDAGGVLIRKYTAARLVQGDI